MLESQYPLEGRTEKLYKDYNEGSMALGNYLGHMESNRAKQEPSCSILVKPVDAGKPTFHGRYD